MIRTVLVATDGSDAALDAVRTAADLARSLGPDARLHVVSAVDYIAVPGPLGKAPDGAPDLLKEQANEALEAARAAVSAGGGVPRAEFHVVAGDVVDGVLDCAREVGADILVAGFHGRNRLVRIVMGSVVGRLVRASPVPVVVVQHGASKEIP
ncbi:MAG: universal stress protein [Candidatus Eremiobacteraeota bacterium]|nr:universal stress protein [Candidatus Eremiobacteraeota bacterium]